MVFDARHKFCPSCGVVMIHKFTSELIGYENMNMYKAQYPVQCPNCNKDSWVIEMGKIRDKEL